VRTKINVKYIMFIISFLILLTSSCNNIQNKFYSNDDFVFTKHSEAIETNGSIFYRELINLDDLRPDTLIEKVKFQNDENSLYNHYIAHNDCIYLLKTVKNDGNYIMQYNLENKTEKPIYKIERPENYQFSLYTADNRYIIWKEDEDANWFKPSLNLYDTVSKVNKKIYTYNLNPETNLSYGWNFNDIIIYDDIIYFDDVVGYEDNRYITNLYSYNIKTEKIAIVHENAQFPFLYKGVSYYTYDKINEQYYLNNIDKSIPKISLGKNVNFDSASKNIFASVVQIFDGETNANKHKAYGIKYFDGEQYIPIISEVNLSDVSCNDDYIGWTSYQVNKPFFYDINNQKIVCVNDLDNDIYAVTITDKYILICNIEPTTSSFIFHTIKK